MWYIKRRKEVSQYLSIFGGWRNKKKPTVRFYDPSKPLLLQWREELKQFKTHKEASLFLQGKTGKAFQHAIPVNGLF
jgi:hypothetical protein